MKEQTNNILQEAGIPRKLAEASKRDAGTRQWNLAAQSYRAHEACNRAIDSALRIQLDPRCSVRPATGDRAPLNGPCEFPAFVRVSGPQHAGTLTRNILMPSDCLALVALRQLGQYADEFGASDKVILI